MIRRFDYQRLVAIAALMMLFSVGGLSTASADDYVLDNSHTSVVFSISHFGYSYCYGRFNTVAGKFHLDDANPAASTFEFSIDASSVDTNDKKRDEHLRNADFFNAKQFPKITFVSQSVTASADGLKVVGEMTMHGQSNPMTLDMKRLGTGKGPGGKMRTGFFLQTELKRSDFGMSGMTGAIGDNVSITISFEGIQQ